MRGQAGAHPQLGVGEGAVRGPPLLGGRLRRGALALVERKRALERRPRRREVLHKRVDAAAAAVEDCSQLRGNEEDGVQLVQAGAQAGEVARDDSERACTPVRPRHRHARLGVRACVCVRVRRPPPTPLTRQPTRHGGRMCTHGLAYWSQACEPEYSCQCWPRVSETTRVFEGAPPRRKLVDVGDCQYRTTAMLTIP